MVVRGACPGCGSTPCKTNGHLHRGPPPPPGTPGGRHCVVSASARVVSHQPRTLIEPLLRERRSLRGIGRAVGGRLTGLVHFLVARLTACPDPFHVRLPVRPPEGVIRRRAAAAAARWRVVGEQANTPWRWRALDPTTRQVIALHVGDRRRERAPELGTKMPVVDRAQAPC
jgi:hypothetical protein